MIERESMNIMTIRKSVLGIAAASALGMGLPVTANAATLVIPFGNTPGTSGKFLDLFTFTAPSAGRVSITIDSAISGPLTNVNFRHNHVSINGAPLSTMTKGAVELLQIINQPVAAGLQTLSIEGSAQRFGTYTGNVIFAVPEPAAWTLMILGLGAVGYAMRRRPAAKVAYNLG